MKKIASFLLFALLFTGVFSSCTSEEQNSTEPTQETVEEYRSEIIDENAALTSEQENAGIEWLKKYSDSAFGTGVYQEKLTDSFSTDRLIDGMEVCLGLWDVSFLDGSEGKIIITEVVSNGERRLSDMYKANGAINLMTVDYAYSRLRLDSRYASVCTGTVSNGCTEGVKEFNITDSAPQTAKYELLVNESINEGKILYGSYSDDRKTYQVCLTVPISETRGIGSVVTQNNTFDREKSVVYLMNKTYKVMHNEETGDLVTVNRKYEEKVLCENTDSEGDDRLIPEIFDQYDDQVLVFTMRGKDDKVIGYGIYDAETQEVTKYENGDTPIALYNGILYHTYIENGETKIGYTDLQFPQNTVKALGEINSLDSLKKGNAEISLSGDGKKIAVAEKDADGVTHIKVFSSDEGSLLWERTVIGYFCEPKYVGFLESGSLFVLCDKKPLCDEYMFIVSPPEDK